MSILKPLKAKYYQKAFELNLVLSGVENGQPQWLGNQKDLDRYFSSFNSNAYFNSLKY